MKNILICILLLTVFTSCYKKTKNSALIIKDCTGSYISKNHTHYLICNDGMVSNIENGTTVSVTYKIIENCDTPVLDPCKMYHKNEGIIELIKINKK